MREWINLFESKVYRMTDETGHPFRIIENPLPAQVATLAGPERTNELKGVISGDGNTVLLWNAYHAHHYEALGLYHGMSFSELFPYGPHDDMHIPKEFFAWATFFLFKGVLTTEDAGETMERLAASPVARRMMGGDLKPGPYRDSLMHVSDPRPGFKDSKAA